ERLIERARVVHAHPHPARLHGAGELADDVALHLVARPRVVRGRARPQEEAVHVLRDEHDVAGARGLEQLRPFARLPARALALELLREVEVGSVRAVGATVVFPGRTPLDPNRVHVPLAVRNVAEERAVAFARSSSWMSPWPSGAYAGTLNGPQWMKIPSLAS